MTTGQQAGIQVEGLAPTLRILAELDQAAYEACLAAAIRASSPLVDAVNRALPKSSPLSNWTEYEPGTADLRRPTLHKDQVLWPLSAMVLTTKTVVQFDTAGRATPGNRLDKSFTAKGYGRPSRVVWPAAIASRTKVEQGIKDALKSFEVRVQQLLEQKGGKP